MSHIFISYARDDKQFAHRLSEDLLDKGYDVWIDSISLVGGMKWEEEIEKNIAACACMLVVVSANAATSPWVEKEINFARKHGKTLIPLIYTRHLDDMPGDLHQDQGYDFTSNYDEALRKLVGTPSLPPITRKIYHLSEVLRDGSMTFGSLAKQWRSTITFGNKPDDPVGLLIERSDYGSKAYLVGRRSSTLKTPRSIQVFLQFSGSVEESAFDQFLLYMTENKLPLWTILVRGPIDENRRYNLPDHDRNSWQSAISTIWNAVDKGIYNAGHASFFMFAPVPLALSVGAAKHFKYPIDIYNLNRDQPTDANRYLHVCTVVPPR